MTPILFHGPLARDRAIERAEALGRPLDDPLGDKGLKVADSRKIVALAQHPGIGDRPPSLVVGPLDLATPEAADALLKTLEDLSDAPLRLVLWADYLIGVIPTIRSRTRHEWCPVPEGMAWPDPLAHYEDQAKSLLKGVLERDPVRILGVLGDAEKKEWPELIQALCQEMSQAMDEGTPEEVSALMAVWPAVRKILDGRGSILVAADALLPQDM